MIKKLIYRFGLAIVLFLTLAYLAGIWVGVTEVGSVHLLVSLVYFVILFLACYFDSSKRLILAAVVLVILLVMSVILGFSKLPEFLTDYINWAMTGGDFTFVRVYECIQLLWLALGAYVLTFLVEKSVWIRKITLFLMLFAGGFFVVYKPHASRAGCVFLVTYIIFNLAELVEIGWNKKRHEDNSRSYMIWLWPIWAAFAIILFLAPVKTEPYGWETTKEVCQIIREEWTILVEKIKANGREDFQGGMAGFDNGGFIGGGIFANDKDMLRVKTSADMLQDLYLVGSYKEKFDGREWTSSEDPKIIDTRMDTLETCYAVTHYSEKDFMNYILSTSLDVDYCYFSTRYYFTPLKMQYIVTDSGYSLNEVKPEDDYWGSLKNYGNNYHVGLYQFNYDRDRLRGLLGAKLDYNEKDWKYVCNTRRIEGYSLEDLYSYREAMKDTYSEQIELSPEMEKWVEQVTEGCQTPIDRLWAIEGALASYKYNKQPGAIPEEITNESQFLDYFVLEKREGYCTYFATALTLLARHEGLPARYVQGFFLPIKGEKEIYLTGDMGHAWTEVYFEGVGWISFEATPGYSQTKYDSWEYEQKDLSNGTIDYEGQYGETESQEKVDKSFIIDARQRNIAIIIGLIALAIIIAGCFCFDILRTRRIYKRKSIKERYLWEMERYLKILSYMGYRRSESETLGEFRERLKDKLEAPEDFLLYESVLYGKAELVIQDINDIKKHKYAIVLKLGRWNRLKEKYILWKTDL